MTPEGDAAGVNLGWTRGLKGQVRIQLRLGKTDLRRYNEITTRYFAYVHYEPCKKQVNGAV